MIFIAKKKERKICHRVQEILNRLSYIRDAQPILNGQKGRQKIVWNSIEVQRRNFFLQFNKFHSDIPERKVMRRTNSFKNKIVDHFRLCCEFPMRGKCEIGENDRMGGGLKWKWQKLKATKKKGTRNNWFTNIWQTDNFYDCFPNTLCLFFFHFFFHSPLVDHWENVILTRIRYYTYKVWHWRCRELNDRLRLGFVFFHSYSYSQGKRRTESWIFYLNSLEKAKKKWSSVNEVNLFWIIFFFSFSKNVIKASLKVMVFMLHVL